MEIVRTNCRYYRGDVPCIFHKRNGIHCAECDNYEMLKERILIIKLGAVGDVIRTTPLLRKLKNEFPHAEITWLTYSPDAVPDGWVDNILDFNLKNIIWLERQHFDWLINLDKDKEAIALSEKISAAKKSGFTMNNYGKCIPMGHPFEERKWITGLRDDANRANTLNYMEEIFGICGYSFSNEEYILQVREEDLPEVNKSHLVVGLNTGCGPRWSTRIWPDNHWIDLARRLIESGYETILLGGPLEDEKNKKIAAVTGVKYFGTASLKSFFNLVNHCDIVVSQVSMAMHVAIALKKYLILLNSIFNRNEFYLYNRGKILEAEIDCLGCWKQKFDGNCKSPNCMVRLGPDVIFGAVEHYGDKQCRRTFAEVRPPRRVTKGP